MHINAHIYIHINVHIYMHINAQIHTLNLFRRNKSCVKLNPEHFITWHKLNKWSKTKGTVGITKVGSSNGQILQLELQNNNIRMDYNLLNKTKNPRPVSMGITARAGVRMAGGNPSSRKWITQSSKNGWKIFHLSTIIIKARQELWMMLWLVGRSWVGIDHITSTHWAWYTN